MKSLIEIANSAENRDDRILASKFLDRIETRIATYRTKRDETLEIHKVYTYFNFKNQLLGLILSTCKEYIQFWDKYCSDKPQLIQMLAVGSKIESQSIELEHLWKKLMSSLNGVDSYEALAYSFYLFGIRNAPFNSDKILRDYFNAKLEYLKRRRAPAIYDNILNDSNTFALFVQKDNNGIEKIIFAS
jgi:hypothetical protein